MPSKNRVLHTPNAVGRLLQCLDDGTLESTVHKELKTSVCGTLNIHCAVAEDGLGRIPTSGEEPAWRNRIDNVNATLRAFTVDGKTTALLNGYGDERHEKLFRSDMKEFVAWGRPGKDVALLSISVPAYRDRLCWRRTAALTDSLLVSELAFAGWFAPDRAPNGVQVDYVKDPLTYAIECIRASTSTPCRCLILMLTPNGIMLRSGV